MWTVFLQEPQLYMEELIQQSNFLICVYWEFVAGGSLCVVWHQGGATSDNYSHIES